MSVRELVNSIRNEVRDTDLTPERASVLCAQLSALLGNILAEVREADMAFNKVLAQCLDAEKKANRARIQAELSPEYARKREAHDLQTVSVEMVRSLRKLQDTYREEMRLSR